MLRLIFIALGAFVLGSSSPFNNDGRADAIPPLQPSSHHVSATSDPPSLTKADGAAKDFITLVDRRQMLTKGFAMDETVAKGHTNEERMNVDPPKLQSLLAEFGEYSRKLPMYKFRELGLEKGPMEVQNFVTWLDLLSQVVKKDPTWTFKKAVDMLIEAGVTVDAVKVLLKLQGHEKFSGQAILMYRYFAEKVPTDSDAMVKVWVDLKLNPYHVFESLSLNRPDALIASPGSSIHWLKYTERLRKDNADIQMTIKDTAMALYNEGYDRSTINKFIEEVKEVDDLEPLAQPLSHEFELLTTGRFFQAKN